MASRSRPAGWFDAMFGAARPLIGVVHLPALPGAPLHELAMADVVRGAVIDAKRYLDGGAAAVLVENFGDVPFEPGAVEPVTVAAMTRVAAAVKDAARGRPVGVNVLRNDARAALAVACAADLDFLRVNVLAGAAVTDQGLLEGDAARLLRDRVRFGCRARILADVDVKHATSLRATSEAPLELVAADLVRRALADALLVTGRATGEAPEPSRLERVRRAVDVPVLAASGVTARGLEALLAHADGFIVGTSLKRGGVVTGDVAPARVRALAAALRKLDLRSPRRSRV